MFEQYPDKCRECNNTVCNCPPLLSKTLGRIAHDGPDPSLLENAGRFMSLAETATFFEVGSKQILVGGARFAVTEQEIRQAQSIAENIRKLDVAEADLALVQQLNAVATSIELKVKVNALNQRDITNLARTLSITGPKTRDAIIKVLGDSSQNDLLAAIAAYLAEND